MGKKKNILILSEVFYPEIGSGANRITNLVIELKEKGYKVDVITSEPSYPNKDIYVGSEDYRNISKEQKIYKDSKITRVKVSNIRRNENFLIHLYLYISFFVKSLISIIFRTNKYDLVISTVPSPFCAIVGIIAKFRFRCKYILDIRDLWPECIKNVGLFRKNKFILKIAYKVEKLFLFFSDAIVINSEGFRDYLVKNKYKKDIIFIPNGITKNEFINYKEIKKKVKKNEKFTVIYTGMIGLPQNIRTLIRVARSLSSNKDIEFKIIGTGIQKERVQQLIDIYNLKNVKIYNPMPKAKIIEEVSKAHIAFAHLRSDSAFDLAVPGKIVDYMGIGIPIVAGVEAYAARIIKDSECGIVAEPDDYVTLSKAILKIYKDKSLQNKYSEAGIKYSLNNFCFEDNLINYVELIEKITRRNKYVKKSRDVRMESLY